MAGATSALCPCTHGLTSTKSLNPSQAQAESLGNGKNGSFGLSHRVQVSGARTQAMNQGV